MRSRIVSDISTLDPHEWDALGAGRQPFVRHAFLAALEHTGCAVPAEGWTPRHVVVEDADGRLVAASAQYLKTHSWGEFVFDFAWAQAYAQAGLDYYPKLVSMCPFTPVTGQRLLVRDDNRQWRSALLDAIDESARAAPVSSLHVLYPTPAEAEALAERGLTIREDCRFLWRNASYDSFDGFLAALRSSKRKQIRRERRRIREQHIEVVTEVADGFDQRTWQRVYALIARTFMMRGHTPYLSLDFFRQVAAAFGEHMLVNLALRKGEIVGAAILFRDDAALYGRYWGASGDFDCLHFETCYYRGIEFCIEHGLDEFDPGTQGEHKVRRGFAPQRTYSAHWIAEPQFRAAIADWVEDETGHVASYMALAARHLPYRRSGSPRQ